MLDALLQTAAAPEESAEPKVTALSDNAFVIEPLDRGFGITLGNSLRRVLLSALPGAAVTHVRMDGVLHEFSTLAGVREDTTEIILNLKKLNLKLMTDKRKLLRLEASGPGIVTPADILPDPEVEILNPELVIATLERGARLGMDLYVAKGMGYVPAEKQGTQDQVIGVIPVDSIFSPIMKVNYTVQDTRIGQRTDFDKLTLEVWTDGSLKPYEAISKAAAILHDSLSLFTDLEPPSKAEAEPSGPESELLETPIEELQLSVRSLNCLKRAGIRTIGELLSYSEEDVMKLKNFGQKSLDEIKDKLMERNLSLQPSTPE
ncbi:MAG: DNA-directed RNA polymerase subunit alpha [Armatimonadetes bacterium]|nr:DNA-directed RNA polymerase subunit alpha [Armatimonadota bacterium]